MATPHGAPLEGVRVIDLTTFLSGPFATQVLADLGADVVKVESPIGDSSRAIPPHFIDGDSAYFLSTNRNKRSIVLNLKDPVDRDRLDRMIADADIVVDNFRPAVLENLRLDPERLVREREGLIWASISGFGQTGPDRNKPAYDMIVQALSGVMSLTGEPDGRAARLGIPAGDTVAGLFATIGILATLSDTRRGGPGRWIDVSMLDAQLSMLSYQSVYTLVSGQAPKAQGAGHDSIPTYRSFMARDGNEIVVTANTERMWVGLCRALARPQLLSDPEFATPSRRLEHRHRLWSILESAFIERDADEWIPILTEHGVPCAPIRNVLEALEEAKRSGSPAMVKVERPDRGEFEAVTTPIRFVGAPSEPQRFPPRLGEHQNDDDLAPFSSPMQHRGEVRGSTARA
ncbi:CaiB/BaiF CoA transferase family protein [Ornithinimicrobium faecis]|uniref:CaiB/BaiF CoA transferase family protein n=1 Tax=Ornithinimicrobium faecis TaxID=2934158 RepID=UPI00211938D5|nr:CoA transferase [Ornithinimicrobium sp. HY1745]